MLINMIPFKIFLVALFFVAVESYNIKSEKDAMMYLNRFGYLDDDEMEDEMSMKEMKPKVMEFQKMCHIKQTGVLDESTVKMMNAPRCGNLDMNFTGHHTMFMGKDRENEVAAGRYRRFAINEGNRRWKTRELTYRIGMFSPPMSKHVTEDVVLREVKQAFGMWSDVTNLDFIHTPNKREVDIELSFTSRFHAQDQFPFDGPGNTLAHAFPPGDGVLGDVHFEDGEDWTINTPKGINVLFVAVHEIGHALGLSHSQTKGAIMQPFYGGYSPKLKLHPDDIAGIQALYGVRESRHSHKSDKQASYTPNVPPPPPTTVSPRTIPTTHKSTSGQARPDLCKNAKIDAITTLPNGYIYAFKGDYVFRIDPQGKGVLSGGPHRVESVFDGLVGNLDAVLTRENGKTYFFKGPHYWRASEGTKIDRGYPKKISIQFPGIPNDVDSAFEWHNAMYFTKDDKIWRFDPKARPFVDEKYPLPLQRWGLGSNIARIDAMFTAPNGHSYFFHGETYSRFHDKSFSVDNFANPPYPRSSKVMWFGCTGGAPNHRDIRQFQPDPIIYKNLLEYVDY